MADGLPPLLCRTSRKSGSLTYPEPLGPPQPVAGNLYLLGCIVNRLSNISSFIEKRQILYEMCDFPNIEEEYFMRCAIFPTFRKNIL